MSSTTVKTDPESFRKRGFAIAPRLLEPELVERLTARLEARSGRSRDQLAHHAAGKATGLTGWTMPDGVTRNEEFWEVIFHPRLLEIVRSLLGAEARFLQHTDLHVGFSSFNWHRDSVARRFGVGSDWDERDEPYRLIRVGFYLQGAEAGGFRLGLIPGTHRAPEPGERRLRRRIERSTTASSHLYRVLFRRNPEPPTATWVRAAAGDAVLFDPRVIHTGTPVDGPKFSVFVAFGVPNRHYVNHWYYYRHLRPDLGYGDIPDALVQRLVSAGLYHDVQPPERPPEGAALPGKRLNSIARRLRFS